ncbi:MAG: alpha/beta fold hydrolase [Casimicrobiaceae bacterium]
MLRLALASLLLSIAALAGAAEHALRRRADLGAAIAPPEGSRPARIVRFRADSVLEKAGLAVGDAIVELNGRALPDDIAFGAAIRAMRGGDPVRLVAKRGENPMRIEVVVPEMRRERIEGLDVRYGVAASTKGYLVRTYTTRPAGFAGKLPVVVFIPWLSCGPIENPFGARDGWGKMLETVMRESKMQVVRIEKPGLGDSAGPDCSSADLDDDLAAFRAGIRAALADPGADPARLYLFGGSIGAAFVPILAQEFAARGVIATGGFSRTWYEHMLDIERRRLTLSGSKASEVNAGMKGFAQFYDLTLRNGLTPAQAIERNPALGKLWYDAPAHQYGRPMRYYQQVQALDVEGAWERVTVPTLIVWGEYDWIMGRDEAERAAALLKARDPKLVTYVVRPGMDHHFDMYADLRKAFAEENGTYDAGAASLIVDWLRNR